MTAAEMVSALSDMGISQTEFARLVSATPKAVNNWCTGKRRVPGAASAYLHLLKVLPLRYRHYELVRRRQGE